MGILGVSCRTITGYDSMPYESHPLPSSYSIRSPLFVPYTAKVKKITSPALLESTSLVFAFGLDMFRGSVLRARLMWYQ